MKFKAHLADATRLGTVLLSPDTVRRRVGSRRRLRPDLRTGPMARVGSLWDALEAGLLRDFRGLSYRRVGEALEEQPGTVAHRCLVYRRLLDADPRFLDVVTRVVRRSLDEDAPPLRHALELPVRVPTGGRRGGDESVAVPYSRTDTLDRRTKVRPRQFFATATTAVYTAN